MSLAQGAPILSVEHLRIRLLGPMAVLIGVEGKEQAIEFSSYARRVFAFLACADDYQADRESIREALWPRQTAEQGRQRLNVALHDIRKALSKHSTLETEYLVVSSRQTVGLCKELLFSIDTNELLRKHRELSHLDASSVSQSLESVKGKFMAGEKACTWISQKRAHFDDIYHEIALRKAELDFQNGDADLALALALKTHQERPYAEDAAILAMRIYHERGLRDSALGVFDALRRAAKDSFDMKVSDKAISLALAIRENAPLKTAATAGRVATGVKKGAKTNNELTDYSRAPTFKSRRNDPKLTSPENVSIENTSYQALLSALGDRLVSSIVFFGPPGSGKSYRIQRLMQTSHANQPFQLLSPPVNLLPPEQVTWFTNEIQNQSIDKLTLRRPVCVVHWGKDRVRMIQFCNALLAIEQTACVLIVSDFPVNLPHAITIKNRQPSLRVWEKKIRAISEASLLFREMCRSHGTDLANTPQAISDIEQLMDYCGANPGLLKQLAQKVERFPVSMLIEWLKGEILACRNLQDPEHNSETQTADMVLHLQDAAAQLNTEHERCALELLAAVAAPISNHAVASILNITPIEALKIGERLDDLGLTTITRSDVSDQAFWWTFEIVTDALGLNKLPDVPLALATAIASHFANKEFIPLLGDKNLDAQERKRQLYSLNKQVPWLEFSFNRAIQNRMPRDAIALSSFLRRHYYKTGQFSRAIEFFQKVIDICETDKDRADFYVVLGALSDGAGLLHESLKHIQCALKYARKANSTIRVATALHAAGITYGSLGRHSRASKMFTKATQLYSDKALLERQLLASSWHAMLLSNELEVNKANLLLQSTWHIVPGHVCAGSASWYSSSAYCELFKDDINSAWRHFHSFSELLKTIDHHPLESKGVLLEAMILMASDQAGSASRFLKDRLEYVISLGANVDAAHMLGLAAINEICQDRPLDGLRLALQAKTTLGRAPDVQAQSVIAIAETAGNLVYRRSLQAIQTDSHVAKNLSRYPKYTRDVLNAMLADKAPTPATGFEPNYLAIKGATSERVSISTFWPVLEAVRAALK
jgi:DNA-binding SARP family transcriptional activator/tetratricopeptide (TPR) repeat protein